MRRAQRPVRQMLTIPLCAPGRRGLLEQVNRRLAIARSPAGGASVLNAGWASFSTGCATSEFGCGFNQSAGNHQHAFLELGTPRSVTLALALAGATRPLLFAVMACSRRTGSANSYLDLMGPRAKIAGAANIFSCTTTCARAQFLLARPMQMSTQSDERAYKADHDVGIMQG